MKKGFTLIELLVVIAVLGILAAVVLVAINPTARIQDARNSGVRSDVGQIGTALEAYFTENNGAYPTALSALVTDDQLKQLPAPPTGRGAGCMAAYGYFRNTTVEEAVVYLDLEPCGSGGEGYYAYWTACGKATLQDTVPSASNAASGLGC